MRRKHFSKPIWFIGAPERNLGKGPGLPIETAYFRISFTVEGKAELKAIISAVSRYCLYVNGFSIAHGPCKGDRMQYYCDELDLSNFLQEGENIIACKVISFPPQEAFGEAKAESHTNIGPYSIIGSASGPCFLFCGEVSDQSGVKTDLSTGYASWFVQNDTALSWLHPNSTMVFCHEEVEAKKIPYQWNSCSEATSGFISAIKRWKTFNEREYGGEIPPYPLFERPIPMLEEIEKSFNKEIPIEVSGKKRFTFFDAEENRTKVILESNGNYIVDLDAGELTTSYVVLETEGGGDAEIKITYAESYGGPFSEGFRGDRLDYRKFTLDGFKDIYRPGGAKEKYDFFWFKTFRILRMEIITGTAPLTLWPPKYRETGYPLECKTTLSPTVHGTWISSLWDISLRTLRRCMHETYEDCPYYEQMQYTLDTRLQILFHYYQNGDTRLSLKTIDDFHRSMLPEGILQSRYPSNYPQVIPVFCISWLLMLLDYYEQTADVSVLERYRPTAEAVILWFKRKKNSRGLIEFLGYWDFTDWAPEYQETFGCSRAASYGPSTIQNMMYIYGLQLLGKMMNILGFKEMQEYYLSEAKSIGDLLLEYCWDEKRSIFKEGPAFSEEYTQHAQMWAVLAGIVSGDKASALMQHALTDKDLIKCTFPLKFFFFRALEMSNLYEKTEAQWDEWKRLLPLNLSTVPETPYDNSRSDCHAWSSLLLYEYPAKILGVYPLEPGYKIIGIRPHGLFLGQAAGYVHTPVGIIEISWEYKGKDFSIKGVLPAGSQGCLILPDGSKEELIGGPFTAHRVIQL